MEVKQMKALSGGSDTRVYSVKRSKTVCCANCRMKKRLEAGNIIVFDNYALAEEAGYRPCQKCRPDLRENGWKGCSGELAEKVKNYVEQHQDLNFSLDEMAEELYFNKFYLVRCFKKETGYTIVWYLNYVRCEHAKKLLDNTSASISDVAIRSGYGSSSYFSKKFREITGQTPKDYRSRSEKKRRHA